MPPQKIVDSASNATGGGTGVRDAVSGSAGISATESNQNANTRTATEATEASVEVTPTAQQAASTEVTTNSNASAAYDGATEREGDGDGDGGNDWGFDDDPFGLRNDAFARPGKGAHRAPAMYNDRRDPAVIEVCVLGGHDDFSRFE